MLMCCILCRMTGEKSCSRYLGCLEEVWWGGSQPQRFLHARGLAKPTSVPCYSMVRLRLVRGLVESNTSYHSRVTRFSAGVVLFAHILPQSTEGFWSGSRVRCNQSSPSASPLHSQPDHPNQLDQCLQPAMPGLRLQPHPHCRTCSRIGLHVVPLGTRRTESSCFASCRGPLQRCATLG